MQLGTCRVRGVARSHVVILFAWALACSNTNSGPSSAGAAGGPQEAGDSGAPPLETSVADDVYVVEGSLADEVLVHPTHLVFPANASEIAARSAGDVLVGRRHSRAAQGNPFGYLREIVSVERNAEGALMVRTEPATLDQVFEQGEGRLVHRVSMPSRVDEGSSAPVDPAWPGLTPQDTGGLAGGQIDVSGVVFGSVTGGGSLGGGASVTVSRASFDFDPDIDIGVRFEKFRVQEFHTILSGAMAAELAFQFQSNASVARKWEKTFYQHTKPLPPLMVGPIPVEVTMRVTVTGGVQVSVTGSQTVEAGVGATSSLQVGGRYVRGPGWSKVSGQAFQLYPIGPTVENDVQTSVKAYVPEVKISFLLYDAVGPFVSISPYGTLGVGATPPCPWTIQGGVEGTFGAEAQIPIEGDALGEVSLNLFNVSRDLAEGSLPELVCGPVEDAGADAGSDAALEAGSDAALEAGSDAALEAGDAGGDAGTMTCAQLAQQESWPDPYCETEGNDACQGHGPATSDCDHCCTGHSCKELLEAEGWKSLRCEKEGNDACAGFGLPTYDCDHCCGSTCTDDDDCSGGVCAWNGIGYCCRTAGAQGEMCFSDVGCDEQEVCAWNGENFMCTKPECTDGAGTSPP